VTFEKMESPLTILQVMIFHHVQQASGWTTVSEIVTTTEGSVSTVRIHCKNLAKGGIFERERVAYPEFRYRLAPGAAQTAHWFRLQEAIAGLG
jgi:predicted transcriptional regulator